MSKETGGDELIGGNAYSDVLREAAGRAAKQAAKTVAASENNERKLTDCYLGLVGHCKVCGGAVADWLCNAALTALMPEAAGHDYWMNCTNTRCVNNTGVGYLQDDPPWLARFGRNIRTRGIGIIEAMVPARNPVTK